MEHNYFEVKLKVMRTNDSGLDKMVTELYLVDAQSFSEAERKTLEIIGQTTIGEIDIQDIKTTDFSEVLTYGEEEKFYKVKVSIVILDDETGKEKKAPCYYMVRTDSVDHADSYIRDMLKDSLVDYVVESVQETKILDIIA